MNSGPQARHTELVLLETARLVLRPASPQQLLALIEQPERFEELTGFAAAEGLREFFVSDDVSPTWLAALRGSSGADLWRHGCFIIDRQRRSVIGSVGFKGPPNSSGIVEVAYGIVPGSQGRGYATEAARALVGYAVNSDGVRLVRAHTLPEENASTRVLLKCGFRHTDNVIDPEDGPVWRWEHDPTASNGRSVGGTE